MRPMRESGRISIVGLASIVSVVLVVVVFMFGHESAASAGERFMFALQNHDVDTLTKMSMMQGLSDDQIRKEWDNAVNVAGKYYSFGYKINAGSQASEKTGAVQMQIIKDIDKPGSYEENYQLPMVKVNGEWKVDVRGTSHDFFPGFPR